MSDKKNIQHALNMCDWYEKPHMKQWVSPAERDILVTFRALVKAYDELAKYNVEPSAKIQIGEEILQRNNLER